MMGDRESRTRRGKKHREGGSSDPPGAFSRRELLKRVGFAGAVAAVPASVFPPTHAASAPNVAETPDAQQTPTSPRDALVTLTASEAETLEAIAARLIPTDENGPGAVEARAARYIDRALGGALAASRKAYAEGLAAVDAYARRSKGARFARLSPADQDAVLGDMENDVATGFRPNSSSFFSLVRAHTIQGTFCDPSYGGNANFVGWDLIGYPGVRLNVTRDEQRMGVTLKPTHRSAYDFVMFLKKHP